MVKDEFVFSLQRFAYIIGTSSSETISNSDSWWTTIEAGKGNDTIYNTGNNVLINGGVGKDSIQNRGAQVTVDGSDGNDKIFNQGINSSLVGGVGDD